MTGKDTPSTSLPPGDSQSAPLPTTSEGPETTPPSLPEEANWVVVIRWATVHSGPSVSAPTVRFYSVGTELHLLGYWDGWFQSFRSRHPSAVGSMRSTIFKPFGGLARVLSPCKRWQSLNKKWLTQQSRLRMCDGQIKQDLGQSKRMNRSSQVLLATDMRRWLVSWKGRFDRSEVSVTRRCLH